MADEKKPDSDQDEPPMVNPDASLAADDPTAVWDADTLREAGLDEVLQKPDSEPPPPVTQGAGEGGPSVVAEGAQEAPANAAQRRTVPQQPQQPMGWGSTLALAIGLGAAVYIVIRLLK